MRTEISKSSFQITQNNKNSAIHKIIKIKFLIHNMASISNFTQIIIDSDSFFYQFGHHF